MNSAAFVPAFSARAKVKPKRKADQCSCGVYRFPHRAGSCKAQTERMRLEWATHEARHSTDEETRERACFFLEAEPGGDGSFDFHLHVPAESKPAAWLRKNWQWIAAGATALAGAVAVASLTKGSP